MLKLPIEKTLKNWISWSPEFSDKLVDQNAEVPNQWVRSRIIQELHTLEDQANERSGKQIYKKAQEYCKNLMVKLPQIFQVMTRELQSLETKIDEQKTTMSSDEYKTAVQDVKAYKNCLALLQKYIVERFV